MLVLESLEIGYPGHGSPLLAPIDLTVKAGAFHCVLGRNGVGKSTLMRSIVGLQRPLAGRACLDGQDLPAMPATRRAQQVAVVLTERVASPGLRVADVVALGRHPHTGWHGALSPEDHTQIEAALRRTRTEALRDAAMDQLSDGQRQRVLIARAMAQQPRLLVLDEVTAFLDLPGRVEIVAMLRRHARETGCIVLLSSHDLDLSLQLADALWLLEGSKRFTCDTPDALVADGAIARAFDAEGVHFDAAQRRFVLERGQPVLSY